MAMARSSRWAASALLRRAGSSSFAWCRFDAPSASPSLSSSSTSSSLPITGETLRHCDILLPAGAPSLMSRSFASAFTQQSSFVSPSRSVSSAIALDSCTVRVSSLPGFTARAYSKRPRKWQGGPHAYIQVEPGAPCPPYSPNAGSVRKRKHNKRMAQRHAFAKAQAQQRKEQTKAALIRRDASRRKRWREGAARARAWAEQLNKQKQQQAVLVSA